MAFGASTKKYYHDFLSKDGTTYTWEIRERTYSAGTPTLLTASTPGHCTTRWVSDGDDEYSPVMGSETTIVFFDDSGGNVLTELFNGDVDFHKDYAIAITSSSGSVLHWIGYMEPVEISISEDFQKVFTLRATDGLGRLVDYPYVSSDSTGAPRVGRDRLTTIIAELLEDVEFGAGFYTSCSYYPRKVSSQLTASNDPLYNIYVERKAFSVSDAGGSKGGTPVSRLDALRAVLMRFSLKIFHDGGAWHIYQPAQFYAATSFYRFAYDSAGAPSGGAEPTNRSSLSHNFSPTTENLVRGHATIGQLRQWNGVSITYEHDLVKVLEQPGFDPPKQDDPHGRLEGRSGPSAWTRNNTTYVKYDHGRTEDNYGMLISATTEYAWEGASGSDLTTAIGDHTASQTSAPSFETGDQFILLFEHLVRPRGAFGASNRNPLFAVAMMVRLNSPTPRYLVAESDGTGSWTTTETWMTFQGSTASLNQVFSKSTVMDTLPADGTLTVFLGPVLEESVRTDSGGAASYVTNGVLWDNVDIQILKPDGEFKPQQSITTNFLSGRDETRIKAFSVILGDGPSDQSNGSLTYSTTLSDRTSDWESVPITGSASGKSIDDLTTREILINTNRPRRLHSATYYVDQRLSPATTIRRDGSNYVASGIDYDWRGSTTSGTWYKSTQASFTDDLVTSIDSGPGSSVFSGIGNGSLFASYINGLNRSFFSEASKRITITTGVIPAGASTSSVAVTAIAEALLQAGDTIVIVAPDLSFYRVRVSADQIAGATSISFDDPDNPGSNFSFANGVDSGANIFFVEDELLTIARLGEQGFAVTVENQNIGDVNATVNATVESLAVTNWIASLQSGTSVYLEQTDNSFVEVVLSADAPRGRTTIYFASTAINVTSGDAVKSSGSVSRSEFIVTDDKIALYIDREGDQIATVDANATSGTSVTCTALGSALNIDDSVYFHANDDGRVIKRKLAANASAGATSFTVTAAFTSTQNITIGDPIIPGFLTGLRVDMTGVNIQNSHLKNTGSNAWNGVVNDSGAITTAGTQGWIITSAGKAEFNDVTVRGILQASTISGTIEIGTGSLTKAGAGGNLIWDSNGLLFEFDRTGAYPGLLELTWDNEGGTGPVTIALSATDNGFDVWEVDNWHVSSSYPILLETTASNANITLTPHGTGRVILDGLSYPSADGTAGQVLYTNGSGALAWTTPAGGGNATHTGEVTGATTLTVDVTAITNRTSLASGLASADEFLVSDSGVLKRVASSVIWAYVDSVSTDTVKCLMSNIEDVSVGNTGTETTLISGSVRGSKNISANTTQTGTVISIVGRGYFTTKPTGGGSDEIDMRFKIGGVTVMTTGAFNLGFDAAGGWWEFIGDATVDTSGASGTVWAQGIFRFYNDLSSTYTDVMMVKTAVSSAINFTSSATMDFTADWTTGDASNTIVATSLRIDIRHRT